jgi:WD40 repeat protein
MYYLEQSTQRRGSERRKTSHLPADKERFLLYAATSWPYHLDLNSATSNDTLILLTKFLRSPSVLTWISTLAEFGQLKILAHASRSLNTLVRRRRKYDTQTNPLLHRLQDLELVELWATDLIKIIGKFGPNLTKDPSSIYKEIPPFCPRDSMIHKQFGMNISGLSVSGISGASWDDSLAKMSLGSGSQAITMICSGNHSAVLTSSGQIVLYSTVTFEAVHTFLHGERVSAISFSHGCDRFVSSGFRTTKVWSVATGKVVLKIQNPTSTRALKIAFSTGDNSLLLASADRGIRIAELNVPESAWSFIDERLLREDNSLDRTVTNSPCCISFSPDATHVAVAYRGFPLSVWSIDPPELISRCRRHPNDPNHLWAPVDRAVWHPYSGEVLGLYLGGYVFKWHPYSGTHQEIYASASVIACSPEGTFFATGDGSGMVKLYNFDHFALVYQLSCEAVVNDISFSPDSRRLYDLRGQFCNVWEPNALLRLDDIDEHERDSEVGSELGSVPTAAISEAVAEIRDPITAISIHPKGTCHAAGDESGIVSIFNNSKVISPIEIFRSSSMLTIEHLDWGADGQHLACTELGGKIAVKLVSPSGSDGKWMAKSIFDIKMEVEVGGIQQIMLNSDSTCLLVGNRSSATLLSLNAEFDAVSQPLPQPNSATKWIKHPTDATLLLAFSIERIRIYRWQGLTEIATLEIVGTGFPALRNENRPPIIRAGRSDDSVADDNEKNTQINRLIATPTGSHILFQYTVTSRQASRYHQTLIFDVSAFDAGKLTASNLEIATSIVKPIFLPEEVENRIEIPLGILSKSRFVYLDKDFSMCSLRLNVREVEEKTVQEHFFLPRDWLNSDCLELCTLLPDGTFLIPHNGEIAAIKSGVMLEW